MNRSALKRVNTKKSFPKGAAAPKGMQRLVAAMQPHRLPVGDNILLPPIRVLRKHSSPLPPKGSSYFSRFSLKTNRIYTSPLLGTNASEKETRVDFFPSQSNASTNSSDSSFLFHQPIPSSFIFLGRY